MVRIKKNAMLPIWSRMKVQSSSGSQELEKVCQLYITDIADIDLRTEKKEFLTDC